MSFADSFHRTLQEAIQEAAKRRASSIANDFITRVEKSGYGGYRVHSTPIDLYIDRFSSGPASGQMHHLSGV